MRASAAGRWARPEHNARNRCRTRNFFFPVGQGRLPNPRLIATRSQLRAYAQSFSAVEVETPSAAAACSVVRPAKNRSLTSSALRGSFASGCRMASSRASKRSPFSSSRTGSMLSRSSRRRPPPAFLVCLCRARSIRMRRMASAAAAKKWPRLCQRSSSAGLPGAGTLRAPGPSRSVSVPASHEPTAPRRDAAIRHTPRAASPRRLADRRAGSDPKSASLHSCRP